MADLFDMASDKDLALAGLLLGMGQGFSQAGQQGGSFMSGLGQAGGSGFKNMLGFQQMSNQAALRKFQLEKLKREMEQEEAIRRGMTMPDGSASSGASAAAPSSPSAEPSMMPTARVAPVTSEALPPGLFDLAGESSAVVMTDPPQRSGAASPSMRRAGPGESPVLLGPGDRRPATPTVGGEPVLLGMSNPPVLLPQAAAPGVPPGRLPPARGTVPPPVLEGQTAQPAQPEPLPQGPMPGQMSPTAPAPRPASPQIAQAGVPPLLQGMPPEIAEQIQRIARVDPKGAYKMLTDFTGEMLKAGRWEIVPHPQDPNTLISVDKYGMRPPVALPPSFAQDLMLKRAGATNVNMRVDQAGGVELAKLGAKALGDAFERLPQINAQLGQLDMTEQALNAYKTGFAGETGLRIKQGLAAVGVKTDASEGEFLQSMFTQMQLGAAPQGQGAVSNYERELYAKAAPNLGNTREGNLALLQAKRAMLRREAEAAGIIQDEAEKNRSDLGQMYLGYGRRLQALGPTFSPEVRAMMERAAQAQAGNATGAPPAPATGGGVQWERGPDGKPRKVGQ